MALKKGNVAKPEAAGGRLDAGNGKPAGAAQALEIGKDIPAGSLEQKPPTMTIEQKPLSAEELARKKRIDEVNDAMLKFNMYPVAAKEGAKDDALAALKRLYKEGDPSLRQIILYVLHETFSQFAEYRIAKNLDYFRKKLPQAEASQHRLHVYRSMFNYSSSLEGLIEIVDLLSELGDDDSAKVLTHQFSFLCAYDNSEAARILRGAVVDALGKSDSVYALKALLSYVRNVENEQLGGRIISSIVEWKEKVHRLKLGQKEKDELMKKINDVVLMEREEGHYR